MISQNSDLCYPSLNSRLLKLGFKTALVKNSKEQVYIMIVETKYQIFDYLKNDKNELVEWFDENGK